MRFSLRPALLLLVMTTTACSSDSGGTGAATAELASACEAHDGSGINRQAIALTGTGTRKGCETLHHYGLFEPATGDGNFAFGDPRKPVAGGIPFVLNARLFSDYTLKHRIVFLPEDEQGNPIPATYRAAEGDLTKANDNFLFPVGTVIAKTFTYPDTSSGTPTERIIETRLLIKHANDGERWEGLPYVWEQDQTTGEWTAHLRRIGYTFHGGEWHYPEPNGTGEIFSGQSDEFGYSIPQASQCTRCHANTDQDAGAAPIGLKARNLNRPFSSEFGAFASAPVALEDRNQIDYWHDQGLLVDVPVPYDLDTQDQIITDIERNRPYNVALDSGDPAADFADLEARARDYLEANCSHCHNESSNVGVDGFWMEGERPLCDANFAINRSWPRIVPGEPAENSPVYRRIARRGQVPEDEQPAFDKQPMPELARQLIHQQGIAVIAEWIEAMPSDVCD